MFWHLQSSLLIAAPAGCHANTVGREAVCSSVTLDKGQYMKTFLLILLFVFASSPSFAARAWLGKAPVAQISYAESSGICGSNGGPCLAIFFEGGAQGCNPSSNHLAIDIEQAEYKQIEALALTSLATKMKIKVYGTVGSCGDGENLSPNGVSIYDTEVW